MITALSFATIVTSLVITMLTIGGELQPSLKSWLQDTFSHHWVGKGLVAVAVFIVVVMFCQLLPKTKRDQWQTKALYGMTGMALAASLMMIGFFTYEYF